MKGAPEIILSKCSNVLLKGKVVPIDAHFKEEYEAAYKRFASYGSSTLQTQARAYAHL